MQKPATCTSVLAFDALHPDHTVIRQAADVIRSGGLVAFPTETVYGLGANALDPAAVRRIFDVKSRPATNPLIVHVASIEQAQALAACWPETATILAHRFWPGPLSLVLLKRPAVPDEVTAGGPTVALRIPANPLALRLIKASGVPIAAPSANRSTQISPTTAAHVLKGLAGQIELVIDGGPTRGGVESTVVDLTTDPVRMLRPGLVGAAEIEKALGKPIHRAAPTDATTTISKSPGQLARHYAPLVPVECHDEAASRVLKLIETGRRVGYLAFGTVDVPQHPQQLIAISMPSDPKGYAAELYSALHDLEDASVERIIVQLPPQGDEWAAIHDRLRRAASDSDRAE